MQTIQYPPQSAWSSLLQRPVTNHEDIQPMVEEILADIKAHKDAAVRKYTLQLDGCDMPCPEIKADTWAAAGALLSPALRQAIDQAIQHIRCFHQAQMETIRIIQPAPGIQCWRKSVGIEKVGLYIPGGTAPLFSTLLMLAIPAAIAGCQQIIVCTPPGNNGQVHPAILYAAYRTGVHRLFAIGGIQAMGAMAYGTETVPKVYKLFGPGNAYVTAAKMRLQAEGIAIDLPAGPSELAILADDTAIPSFVAADLLSQAEHGTDSQVILVSDRPQLLEEVQQQIQAQLVTLPRKDIIAAALQHSKCILVHSMEEGMALLNTYAPEHLVLACNNAAALADQVINAGSVFLGNYSPESAGDYASGTNHTLPTNGYATAYSGVSLDSFLKKITFQKLSRKGLAQIAATIEEMAVAEGLQAHANAVTIRMQAAETDLYPITPNPFDLETAVRKNIRQLVPYASARATFTGNATLLLDANERSEYFLPAYNRYPDPLQRKLKEQIAKLKKIPADQLFLGNGSDEAIDLLFRIFCEPRQDNVLILPPTYGMYEVAANIHDIAVKTVLLTNGFQPDTARILAAIDDHTRLLFICSPNNPTGNIIPAMDIHVLLRQFKGIVVIDEAYIDFAGTPSWTYMLAAYPNLVVLQTLSKAWGLAGLRIGMAFASTTIIDLLNRVKPPYNIGLPSQELALQGLQQAEVMQEQTAITCEERERLIDRLQQLPFVLQVYPSAANFILVRFLDATEVYNYLVQQGIVVRNRSGQPLCDNCLRITIGNREENDQLYTTLYTYSS